VIGPDALAGAARSRKCARCGRALGAGSAFCTDCGLPVAAAPHLARPDSRRGERRGLPSGRLIGAFMACVGTAAVLAAVTMGFLLSTGLGSVAFVPDRFECGPVESRSIRVTLPALPADSRLATTIISEQGNGAAAYTSVVSDFHRYQQPDGTYSMSNTGPSGPECSVGPGTFLYAIWELEASTLLASGSFTVIRAP